MYFLEPYQTEQLPLIYQSFKKTYNTVFRSGYGQNNKHTLTMLHPKDTVTMEPTRRGITAKNVTETVPERLNKEKHI